jgi:membrane protein DedA with SNARE-associated domain
MRLATRPTAPVHHPLIPRWLTHLGSLGLFAVAVIDSSVIPLPLPGSTDLLLLWLVSHHGNEWLAAASAVTGSVLGGYTCWLAGLRGGEAALQKYSSKPALVRVFRWAENHSTSALFFPALLPPPIPLMPFLIAAGALKVSRKRFLLAFGAGRIVRYGLLAWIGVAYGRGVVRLWSGALTKWAEPLTLIFILLLATALCVGVWQFRKQQTTLSTAPAK